MNWFIGIAGYVVIWWVVIFAILPLGVRPAEEGDLGHGAGAPSNPGLKRKALLTTVVAAVVWVLIYALVKNGLLDRLGS